MKTIKILMSIFVLTAIMVSCENGDPIPVEESNLLELKNDFEKSIMDKAGPKNGAEILKNIYNPSFDNALTRAPITYDGELCPGVVNSGTAVPSGYSSFANADFWYFSGDAGDVVTIEVDRTNCEMDPVMILYEGSMDDATLVFVAGADDNDPAACAPACFSFDDPLLTGVVLPSTGVYTLAVWDWISGVCASPPMTYDVVVTGQNPCIIVIDGCDTGIDNQTLPDGTTMQSVIDACAAAAANHGDFVSCVAHATNTWKKAGLISGKEKGIIQSCAAGADIP